MNKKFSKGLHIVIVLSIAFWGTGLASLTPISLNPNTIKASIGPVCEEGEVVIIENMDSINIGDTSSETGYNLTGWSDAWVNPGWGGNYGGGSSDGSFRLLMGPGDGCGEGYEDATLDFDAGENYVNEITFEHLDGSVDDSFDAYINNVFIGHYTGGGNQVETWVTTTFNFAPVSGIFTVKFTATEPDNAWCANWGQIAFSNIEISGYECESQELTIYANKIVCESETDLPNWHQGADITANTAQDYVDSHPNCHFEENWDFQWGIGVSDPGEDYYGYAGGEWNNFDTLTGNGTAATVVITDEYTIGDNPIKLREVLKEGYIPFSYSSSTPGTDPANNISAEFWCHTDVANYDNYDYIHGSEWDGEYYCIAFNVLKETPDPYCGDEENNQDWEECDDGPEGSDTCTSKCLNPEPNDCSDLVLARVNVDEASNTGNGDISSDIYLGSDSYVIPAGTWFALYYNGSYITDPDIAAYEDVPGLAVERLEGSVRAVLYGTKTNADKEHIHGDIEFYNASILDPLRNDPSNDKPGNNTLENGFNGTGVGDYDPVDDEVWLEGSNTTNSYFYLTTTTADDGYYTDWQIIEDCNGGNICGVKFFDVNQDGINNNDDYNIVDWMISLWPKTECEEGDEWADEVVSFDQGPNVAPERSDSSKALGVAENNDTMNFVSLGIAGELILKFDNFIENGIGDDIQVIETSWGNPSCAVYPEYVRVYASQNGVTWTDLGVECQEGDPSFDLGPLAWAQYVKLVDETGTGSPDGFDVDGVKALHCLTANTQAELTTYTTENGYCFENLEADYYYICEETRELWFNTTPICHQVLVEEGGEYTIDFGNYEEEPEPSLDFGDAPDSYGTLLTSNGARHTLIQGMYMGLLIDAELDGQPSVPADGDDILALDDEDGVTFVSQLVPGSTASIDVVASGPALLQAWIDFDYNGVFDHPLELIAMDHPVIAGVNTITFTVPSGAVIGQTYARFRLSSIAGLPPIGSAPDGEVEDYTVEITSPTPEPYCGDGIVNNDEECDGTLNCSENCTLLSNPVCDEGDIVMIEGYMDLVNVGDGTSETGHNLTGWSDAWVYPGWGGNYGGGSSDGSFRLLMGPNDGCGEGYEDATLDFDAGENYVNEITFEHLDGSVDDSFDVYINNILIGHYTGGGNSSETWITTTFDFAPVTGIFTVKFTATEPDTSWCATWGQVAFSWTGTEGYTCEEEPGPNPQPYCGDGTVDPGEQCDDGNTNDGDGCSSQCTIEEFYCGDFTIDDGEECDDGPTGSGTCTPDCTIIGGGGGGYCGDTIVNGSEECDDGNTTDGDGCSAQCTTEGGGEVLGEKIDSGEVLGVKILPETGTDNHVSYLLIISSVLLLFGISLKFKSEEV